MVFVVNINQFFILYTFLSVKHIQDLTILQHFHPKERLILVKTHIVLLTLIQSIGNSRDGYVQAQDELTYENLSSCIFL